MLCLGSHSNTKTKNQSSTLTRPRHLEPEVGTWRTAIIVPGQDLCSIWFLFTHFLPMRFLRGLVRASSTLFPLLKRALKAEYSTHFEAFQPVVLISSCHQAFGTVKGLGTGSYLQELQKGGCCYVIGRGLSSLNSLHALHFQLLNFCACSSEMTLGWFQKILFEPPQR